MNNANTPLLLRFSTGSSLLAAALVILTVPSFARSQSTWTGASSPDLNWSASGNWTAAPSGQNVIFTNAGGGANASTVTSVVDDDYSIGSLTMDYMNPAEANTNTYQNIQIDSGNILTVNGSLSVGASTEPATYPNTNYAHSNRLTIGGAGSLVVNGGGTGSVTILPPNTTAPQFRYMRLASLDLQNLSSFSATNLDRFVLGADRSGGVAWISSQATLAQTNTIQANTLVMDGYAGSSRMEFGTTNTLHVDSILIGHQSLSAGQQTWAQGAATMTFRSGVTGGTIQIRGRDGVSAADILVGRSGLPYLATFTGTAGEGTLNLAGGTTDAKVNNFVIGLADQGTTNLTSGAAVVGTATLGAGLMEAANVVVGRTTTGNTNNNAGITAAATLNIINGGTLDVAGNLIIGDAQQSHIALTSTVNLQSGTLKASTISTGANAADNKTVVFNWSQSMTIQNHAASDLSIEAGVNLTLLGTGEHRFNIDTGRSGTVASNILSSVAAQVVKNGGGVLTISSSGNTYTGQTIINSGTLIINGNISSSSGVTVGNGNTLAGSGTVSAISILGGGRIGHNDLTATSLSWNGVGNSATAQFQIDLDSSSRLTLSEAFTKGGGSYFVFDFLDTGFVGVHALLSGWSSTNFSASDFSYVNLADGLSGTFAIDGNTLQFTVIPESSTVSLCILGALVLMVVVRRRYREVR